MPSTSSLVLDDRQPNKHPVAAMNAQTQVLFNYATLVDVQMQMQSNHQRLSAKVALFIKFRDIMTRP